MAYVEVAGSKLTCLLTPCSRVLLENLTGREIPRVLWNPKVIWVYLSKVIYCSSPIISHQPFSGKPGCLEIKRYTSASGLC